MLRVSALQAEELAAQSHEPYLIRVAARIRTDFPEEFAEIDETRFRDMIRSSFERMREYGFHQKQHLHRLIVLDLLYGPSFEDSLPEDVRRTAFPKQLSANTAPEAERFWAIYRASDGLERDAPTHGPITPHTDLTFVVDGA